MSKGIKYSGTRLSHPELASILNEGGWVVDGGRIFSSEGSKQLPLKIREARNLWPNEQVVLIWTDVPFDAPFHQIGPVMKEIRRVCSTEIRIYSTLEVAHQRAMSEGGGIKMLPVTVMALRLVRRGGPNVANPQSVVLNKQDDANGRAELADKRRKIRNAERRIARSLPGVKVKFVDGSLELSVPGKRKKVVIKHHFDGDDSSWTTVNGIDLSDPAGETE